MVRYNLRAQSNLFLTEYALRAQKRRERAARKGKWISWLYHMPLELVIPIAIAAVALSAIMLMP
jgi:hypothetical protein